MKNKMIKCLIAFPPLLLSACAPSQLEQNLANKDRGEKQAILANECRKEANLSYMEDQKRIDYMNALCDEMVKEMKNHPNQNR